MTNVPVTQSFSIQICQTVSLRRCNGVQELINHSLSAILIGKHFLCLILHHFLYNQLIWTTNTEYVGGKSYHTNAQTVKK